MHRDHVHQGGNCQQGQQREGYFERNQPHVNVLAPENGKVEQYQRQEEYGPAEKSAEQIVYGATHHAHRSLCLKKIDAQEKRGKKHGKKSYYKGHELVDELGGGVVRYGILNRLAVSLASLRLW